MNPLGLLSLQTFKNPEYTEPIDPDLAVVPALQTYFESEPETKPNNMATGSQTAPPLTNLNASLYLANACGNCARAYGQPIKCALGTLGIDRLTCCEFYLSPFDLK